VEKAAPGAGSAANVRRLLAVGRLFCRPNRGAQSSNRGLFWRKLKMMAGSRQESIPQKRVVLFAGRTATNFRASGNKLKHMFDISAELC
jgi:hypothetical protein